ncbi:MAG: thiamine pyrophosphate-dependent enzyme [Thermaerobacterales bacterium]
MKTVFQKPCTLTNQTTSYCPGCGHGLVHRLVAEVIDELNLREDVIGVTSAGCSIFMYKYLDIDCCEAPHGRAPAVATGIKRVHPGKPVFTYQGDGDIASIGIAEIIHAANRGENFTVIFVNNGVYGMTGGQMAPTSLLGQVTTTSAGGRDAVTTGYPIRMCELLDNLHAPAYLARGAASSPKNLVRLKRWIKRAFQYQLEGRGFSLIEVLAACPENWRQDPAESLHRIEQEMVPVFPLGEWRVPKRGGEFDA